MPDFGNTAESSWDTLDARKFADEEALVADILKSFPLDERARTASVRRGRELVVLKLWDQCWTLWDPPELPGSI